MQQLQVNPRIWSDNIYRSLLNIETKIQTPSVEDITYFHNPAHYSTQPATIDEVVTEIRKLRKFEVYQCEDSLHLNEDIFNIFKPRFKKEDLELLKSYQFVPQAFVQVHSFFQIERDKHGQILVHITGPKAIHDEALQMIHENFIVIKEHTSEQINFEKDFRFEYSLRARGKKKDGSDIESIALTGSHSTAQAFPLLKEQSTFTQYLLIVQPQKYKW